LFFPRSFYNHISFLVTYYHIHFLKFKIWTKNGILKISDGQFKGQFLVGSCHFSWNYTLANTQHHYHNCHKIRIITFFLLIYPISVVGLPYSVFMIFLLQMFELQILVCYSICFCFVYCNRSSIIPRLGPLGWYL
jgi:hypothetical protein